ncbi:MAG: hypothetical protein SOZ73_04005 [Campylobacter sp.]|uniref:hypothetical protein n=1 Tax=Campylobacter sp. TaxID=205 RepID=UPI002A85941E|nr:hypothetical protein [Campylobacter sp.]MCI7076933.1 hypothetical protein [Campylobacter sp.]MDY3668821.1 hypothetical protein [Campylobacter sp.]MDY3776375.1 hypothetical protein [Campylobacter sp.]
MDPKLAMIAANGAKFGNEMAQNSALMSALLEKKNLGFKSDDLKTISEVFYALDEVKKNAQMSGD